MSKHVIEDHDLAGDERRACLATIAVVRLPQQTVKRAGVQVIQMTAIGPKAEPYGQLPINQRLEKAAHILAITNTGKRGVLPSQAIAAMECDRRDEAGLP
jgi:hypothetical protein